MFIHDRVIKAGFQIGKFEINKLKNQTKFFIKTKHKLCKQIN